MIEVSKCTSLNLLLIDWLLLGLITGGMEMSFLEQGLVMLKVASTCMESQDAHEYVLIIGQVGHSFDILDMGMLHKKYSLSMYIPVHTSTYWYIHCCTAMCKNIPLGLGTTCCLNSPTRQSRVPCAGYCVLSRSSIQLFPQFFLADSSGGGQGVQQLFGASQEGQPLKYGTVEMRYSIPCIV